MSSGPSDSAGKPAPQVPAETLLSKFAAVWIWTVFFGVSGGLSYSFLTPLRDIVQIGMMGSNFGFRPWMGPMAGSPLGAELMTIALPVAFAVGLLASVASWLFLYLYFALYLVPVVFQGGAIPYEDRRRRLAGLYLNRTYQLVIIAALARATPDLVYLFFPLLTWLGAF
jgi:hypothetical protein